ncbi:hypothetical protein BH24BAC1_BH24BAC1_37610 [soil metagenome]
MARERLLQPIERVGLSFVLVRVLLPSEPLKGEAAWEEERAGRKAKGEKKAHPGTGSVCELDQLGLKCLV